MHLTFSTSFYHSLLEMSFNFDVVISSFKACAKDKFNLEAYNRGYNELYSFFLLLGTVFKFIAADIREKIDMLVK